ncbi:MAG: hypothetical protein ACYC3I_15005 [Gemmataceae bacterium]
MPADSETLPRDAEQSNAEAPQRDAIRRLPLAPVGGWRWLWRKQEAATTNSTITPKQPSFTVSRPRRMRRCGRATLLWVFFWYSVLTAISLLFQHRWQRTGPANEERKWPVLRQLASRDPEQSLVVMLGSSRACWAFRAGALNGRKDSDGQPLTFYNFGIPATGPISELFCLRDMLAEGIRPRLLLIEFLPPLMCEHQRGALTEEGMIGFESLSAHRFLQWFPYLHRPGKYTRLWLEGRIAPWYSFRRQLQLEVKCLTNGQPFPTHEPIDAWGWHIPVFAVPFPAFERARRLEVAYGGYFPGLNRFRLGKKPTEALHELLDLCRREQIPAALVVMPESSQFRNWYSDEGKTALRGLLDEVSQTYGVPVINAQCWVADEDFEDGHHTQLHGAEVFTAGLHAELAHLLERSKSAKSE